jgi:hypothetical protein
VHQVVPLTDLRHVIDLTAARNLRIAAGLLGAVASVLEGAASVFEEDYGHRHELAALPVMRPSEPMRPPVPMRRAGPSGTAHATTGARSLETGLRRYRDPAMRRHLAPVPVPHQTDTRWPHPVRGPRRSMA